MTALDFEGVHGPRVGEDARTLGSSRGRPFSRAADAAGSGTAADCCSRRSPHWSWAPPRLRRRQRSRLRRRRCGAAVLAVAARSPIDDGKPAELAPVRLPRHLDVGDQSAFRSPVTPGDESPDGRFLALGQDLDASVRAVSHPSAQAQPPRLVLRRGAKPYSLDSARYDETGPYLARHAVRPSAAFGLLAPRSLVADQLQKGLLVQGAHPEGP